METYTVTLSREEINIIHLCLSKGQETCDVGSKDWQFFEDLMKKLEDA